MRVPIVFPRRKSNYLDTMLFVERRNERTLLALSIPRDKERRDVVEHRDHVRYISLTTAIGKLNQVDRY